MLKSISSLVPGLAFKKVMASRKVQVPVPVVAQPGLFRASPLSVTVTVVAQSLPTGKERTKRAKRTLREKRARRDFMKPPENQTMMNRKRQRPNSLSLTPREFSFIPFPCKSKEFPIGTGEGGGRSHFLQ